MAGVVVLSIVLEAARLARKPATQSKPDLRKGIK